MTASTNYRDVFEYANDVMVIHDKDSGEILHANRKACEVYGSSVEELRRMTIGDLTRNHFPYDNDEGLRLVREAATALEGKLFEWVIRDRAGTETAVEVSLKPIMLDGVVRVLAIARDITERKQAEAALRQKERHYRRLIERSADGMRSCRSTASYGLRARPSCRSWACRRALSPAARSTTSSARRRASGSAKS